MGAEQQEAPVVLGGTDDAELGVGPLMTAAQVASRMKRTRSAVYDRVYRGQMPGVVRIGRSVYFRKTDIIPWLERWASEHPEEFK